MAISAEGTRELAPPRTPTQRSTQWVLFGSLASGLGAYAFQVIGVRALGEVAYAPISILWTFQYLVSTIALYSAEAYVTRTVTLAGGDTGVLRGPVRIIGAWIATLSVLVAVLSLVFREALFGGDAQLALVAGLLVAAYGAFFVIKGRMAGTNRFRSYGAATALESIGRILIAVPVLAVAATADALAWVMPIGPALVAVWWLFDRGRAEHPDTIDLTVEPVVSESDGTGRFLLATTIANACSQTLLAAGPLVLLPLGASAAEVSVFFVTITAARVPLVFAFGGLLSRLLPPLTRMARAGQVAKLRRITLLVAAGFVALGAVGAVAGRLVGPQLVALFFGEGARPDATFVALAAVGVMLATGATLLNQVLIARGAESRLVAPWLTALAVAALVIALVDGTATFRVAAAFAVGEAVALAGVLLVALTAATARPPDPEAVIVPGRLTEA